MNSWIGTKFEAKDYQGSSLDRKIQSFARSREVKIAMASGQAAVSRSDQPSIRP